MEFPLIVRYEWKWGDIQRRLVIYNKRDKDSFQNGNPRNDKLPANLNIHNFYESFFPFMMGLTLACRNKGFQNCQFTIVSIFPALSIKFCWSFSGIFIMESSTQDNIMHIAMRIPDTYLMKNSVFVLALNGIPTESSWVECHLCVCCIQIMSSIL